MSYQPTERRFFPIETKPSLSLSVKCTKDGKSDFDKLKKHFENYLENPIQALESVYGIADPEVTKSVELAVRWGFGEKSIFIFFKPLGSNFHVHLQGFGSVKSLIKDRDWLRQQFKDAGTKCNICDESLNVKASFTPRRILSFFVKDFFSFLLPTLVFLVLSLVSYLWSKEITGEVLNSLYVSAITFGLWVAGTIYLYLRGRKTYVLELPED
ncbi:MAG TPA: hypothetical protein VK487_00540 [Candidatus Bathyarchaeia archaeon]|nr:hypothetical protein [Candidatus Bathyarchaeia archaeon]